MAEPFTLNFSGSGYTPISVTEYGNIVETISTVIPANTANVHFTSIIFANTSLKTVFGYCTDANLTMKTNNATVSSASNQTFTFLANNPISWNANSPMPNPFTANVSNGVFFSNADAANATLRITFTYNN